jgi:lipoteichoic acid synthase
MRNETLRYLRAAPAWGTLLAGLFTAGLFARFHDRYDGTDLAFLLAACLLELLLLELLTRAALGLRPWPLRIIALLVPAVLGLVYVAQLYSTWLSGGYVPPIAFANSEVAGVISFRGAYILLGSFALAFLSHACWYRPGPRRRWGLGLLAGLLATGAYAGLVHDQPLARGITLDRGEAPVSSFVHSLARFLDLDESARLSASELNAARNEFRRFRLYGAGFPAGMTRTLPARPNVIVVFTEGMSARWIQAYGGIHPGLTPNLDQLAGRSLMFTNYYNHTAATFRGLRGQLTSGHQEPGGFNQEGTGQGQRDVSGDLNAISRISVAEILRRHGYQSTFFLSQQAYLNTMVQTLGFDQVLGRDVLFDRHLRTPGRRNYPAFLSDHELFQTMLAELESQPADRPFFAAAYNFQTHAFTDGELKYGDGDNPVLNRFHSYDRDIGRFVQAFMASPLHENTVLVFTADHSTFPEPDTVRADPGTPRYFVDTIPLLLYWKGVQHQRVDLHGRNSLDLAPSLLALLQINPELHNLFLGCSFFEQCGLDRISNIGEEYILTDPQRSYTEGEVPEIEQDYFQQGKAAIERFKAMDLVIGHAQ